MKHAKYLLVGVPALLAVTLAFTPLVRAESGDNAPESKTRSDSTSTTTKVAETETGTSTDNTTSDSTNKERAQEVAKERAEVEKKIQEVKDENKTRLTDVRLKACENHQSQINSIIQKRSEQATNQLAVFTKISDRVQAFVKDNNLTVANYDSLVATIHLKDAAAQAAIDANTATQFDCTTASADKPGILPRTTIDAVRTALQDYRTAIKDLITGVMTAAGQTTSSTSSTTTTAPAATTTSGEVSQ